MNKETFKLSGTESLSFVFITIGIVLVLLIILSIVLVTVSDPQYTWVLVIIGLALSFLLAFVIYSCLIPSLYNKNINHPFKKSVNEFEESYRKEMYRLHDQYKAKEYILEKMEKDGVDTSIMPVLSQKLCMRAAQTLSTVSIIQTYLHEHEGKQMDTRKIQVDLDIQITQLEETPYLFRKEARNLALEAQCAQVDRGEVHP